MNGGIFNNLIRKDNPQKWGLVLAGGGTKGAYEVGAWKALKELRIPIRGITGTSIGALNAALMLMDDQPSLEKIYREITLRDVLPIEGDIDPEKNVFDPVNLLAIGKEYLTQGGLDNAPLRHMLEKHLNLEKVYNSSLDLGVVTFDIDSLKPKILFKDQIPQEKLIAYLLASANFPIFKAQKVDGVNFMDGGLYDNMPFNPLIERGYTHLIAVDINGIGMTRIVERDRDVYLKLVSCSENLGGTFEFNPLRIQRNMHLGYLDTLKAFHKLFGNIYFFRRPAFNDLLLQFDLETIEGLELAARTYGMERCRIITAEEFLAELESLHGSREREYRQFNSKKSVPDLRDVRNLIRNGAGIAAFSEWIREDPNFRRSHPVAKAFPETTAAAAAMNEVRNLRKL